MFENMKSNTEIVIPRQYFLNNENMKILKYELHGFSDASPEAYGCCIYLKAFFENGTIKMSLVTAKSRVSPMNKQTLPRTELLGNLILARLMKIVHENLSKSFYISNTFYWSDSQICLSWIHAEEKIFKTFVQNRVIEIRNLSQTDRWFYI